MVVTVSPYNSLITFLLWKSDKPKTIKVTLDLLMFPILSSHTKHYTFGYFINKWNDAEVAGSFWDAIFLTCLFKQYRDMRLFFFHRPGVVEKKMP